MRFKKTSEHTKIGWWLGAIAIATELSLGLTYAFSTISDDRLFGIITLIEGAFALVGLLFLDVIYGKQFDIKPDYFKRVDTYKTVKNMAYTLIVLIFVQFLLQFPLTVRTWQIMFAIWFAAVSEELFFRGLLLAPFLRVAEQNKGSQDILYEKLTIKLSKKTTIISISLIEIMGISISAMFFTILHINYYSNKILLIMVFISGIVLGIAYQKHRNLLANILAHLFLNLIVTITIFGQLNF